MTYEKGLSGYNVLRVSLGLGPGGGLLVPEASSWSFVWYPPAGLRTGP